ncbi:MAG: ATP-dependent DNA helicase RecQ [Candidatus Hydrothermae bacterium]|nr:ATP-dependent DNA helicase RecQ [Candidatus Hydrothermae bacterium]
MFFPRTIKASSRRRDKKVRFVESAAVPATILEYLNAGGIDERLLNALAQWRIDYPDRGGSFLDEKTKQVLSVLEKILTRGRITLLSPSLEGELLERFGDGTELKADPYLSAFLSGYERSGDPGDFDRTEEAIFYGEVCPYVFGRNFVQFVVPGISLSSLIDEETATRVRELQRVDFAFFHPLIWNPLAVEIEGRTPIDEEKKYDDLARAGYQVLRIKARDLMEMDADDIAEKYGLLGEIRGLLSGTSRPPLGLARLAYSFKFAHELQFALFLGISEGFLTLGENREWRIYTDLHRTGLFDDDEAIFLAEEAAFDFAETFARLLSFYSMREPIPQVKVELIQEGRIPLSENAIFVSFTGSDNPGLPTIELGDAYFPFHIAHRSFPVSPLIRDLEEPSIEDLRYFLRYLFRKEDFWEGQFEGIKRAMSGRDTLLLLPTGAGKSLVYQLASMLLPGRTVVIDPIISLMEDQIDNLSAAGIGRCIVITSQLESPEHRARALSLFGKGEYIFAFVAPERFQTQEFRNSLRSLTEHTPIALIVVDEAHCVSEWGHDFRTAYLNIGRTSREYCRSFRKTPPLLALTGTASRAVLKDIQRELGIEDFEAIITPRTFDRPELRFSVIHSKSAAKPAVLRDYLMRKLPSLFGLSTEELYVPRGKDTHSGLIFCLHVNGEFGVEGVADYIRRELGIPADIYSGKEPKGRDPEEYRDYKSRVLREFKRNEIPLLVCTKAFGMGIDKPNIRFTVHYGLPPSIEAFYQEAGRAGRDRKKAYCTIMVSVDNPGRSRFLLDPNTLVEEIQRQLEKLKWDDNDDVTRVLYLHTRSFRGIKSEKEEIRKVIGELEDISMEGKKLLHADEERRPAIEKALHRLLLIGVVADYTIDYSRNIFTVYLSGYDREKIIETYGKYIESYLHSRREVEEGKARSLLHLPYVDFVMGVIGLLLNFIYDVIERSRRRALQEMLLLCEGRPTDRDIRDRILRYLEATEFTEDLEDIITSPDVGFQKCRDLFGKIRSLNDAAELRGQVIRYLESYPDHPALLMLRAISEIYCREGDRETAREDFLASLKNAVERYARSDEEVVDFGVWALRAIAERDEEFALRLMMDVASESSRSSLRKWIERLPDDLSEIPAWELLSRLGKLCEGILSR